MVEYELRKVRGQHFAKVVDDEIVGMASEGEVVTYSYRKTLPDVEPGIIEVALALSAVFAVLASLAWPAIFRIFAGVGFFVSIGTADMFSWVYVMRRIPLVSTHFLRSRLKRRIKGLSLMQWLTLYYPVLFVRLLVSMRGRLGIEETVELAYCTLFLSMRLAGLALAMWVVLWPIVELIIERGPF